MRSLDHRAREIISQADNFYIATHLADNSENVAHGADVSHRGGKPGFVRIDDDKTLTFPDFSGNYHFNTLGNILLNPLAGLLFIDFATGDLLCLTCSAKIIWDSEERRAFTGAERLVEFTLDEGLLIEDAMPIRWDLQDFSPGLDQTGSWEEVARKLDELEHGNTYRDLKVTRVEKESDVITSFYLGPEDGSSVACHKAGQFLPIEIHLPGAYKPVRRTYTISNAPNGNHYRLSIKREPPAKADMPPGVASNYFHDQLTTGSTVRTMTPRGKFVLDESSTRPVVLLSSGVGVTPMISMLEQILINSDGCGCNRKVWFIHGATNGKAHAFERQVRELEKRHPCLTVHIRYSRPTENDVEADKHDSAGHVDIDLIKSLLPFDDYEFYMCGPVPFLESVHEGLKELSIPDERIHYEFFGVGATLAQEHPGETVGLATDLADRTPVPVRFSKSLKVATWDPTKGTLLDLAESEGLQPAYSCRSGICQTCSISVVSGEVDYLEAPMATPEAGDALLCCSYPKPSPGDEEVVLDL
jgi:ferredoxin-NADP reductase